MDRVQYQTGMHELDSLMDQLVRLSRHFGGKSEFVIAGGGNTSLKSGDRLFIKASGTALACVEADAFVEMDREALAGLLERDLGNEPDLREKRFKEAILAARIHPERGQRPSVECVLHNTIPRTYVVHTHSTLVNAITCCLKGERLAGELFGDEIVWVPYVDPGFTLAKALKKLLEEYSLRTGRDCPGVVLMQNHGLIVCGETEEEIAGNTESIIQPIERLLGRHAGTAPFGSAKRLPKERVTELVNRLGPMLRGLLGEGGDLKIVSFDDCDTVANFVGAPAAGACVRSGPLTPDQIVYCNSFPLWFGAEPAEEAASQLARLQGAIEDHKFATGSPPIVVLVPGLGMFAAGNDYAQADTARLVYIESIKVMNGAQQLGGVRHLPPREREFIEHWEVEAYRRKVAAGVRRQGKVAGKVAVVTGAAQGFGLEIARHLASEGAHVVMADINADSVREHASQLGERWGSGRARGLGLDVANGSSVAEGLHDVVRTYGGLDLLVSNAGVLRAGSVKTQPEIEFDLVTSVNYKGYFLCVRNAAPVMALQHLARSDHWSDIIQINSKSGLVGSNRNAAYSGGKFGGIGLTQSFALELVEDGIKVNAVCPGNFFDGPLWSDPETGLFVQYLRTGKVPGARTTDDVRRHYETKVPMGRGCTTEDVMQAIYYLIAQKYETGQALPVTGGQIMLS